LDLSTGFAYTRPLVRKAFLRLPKLSTVPTRRQRS
jgi:hypothetical protein